MKIERGQSNKTETPFESLFQKIKMKKFLLPFQNMVRADLFSGSLAVCKDFKL